MPNVTQRTVRTTQPQTAVGIDYANPITRGLVACLDANRRVLINGSETRPLTLTNPVRRASQQEFGTVTLQTTMQAIKAPPAISSNVTMLSLFIPSTEITERTYGQLGQTNSGNMLSVSSGDGATAGVVRFKIYLGSMRTIGASQANEGVPNLAIARHINGQSQNLWLNGVKDASSGAFTGNSIGFGFYGFAASSGMSGASILNAVWNRALTDAEIKSLSENPWQIFAPERRVIAFDAIVESGGTIDLVGQNATQSNTSSTGAITQNHALSGENCNQVVIISTDAISQTHNLTGAASAQNHSCSTGSISQNHALSGANSSQLNTSSTGAISTDSTVTLSAENSTQNNGCSTGSISQAHDLLTLDSTQNNISSTGAISTGTVAIDLIADNGIQVNLCSSGAISQAHNLIGANSLQRHFCSTGSINPSVVFVSSALRRYVVPIESRKYVVNTENRSFVV
jgi:hypothetical protein